MEGSNLGAGAQVVMASCCDYRFPPDNMLEVSEETFWATTGGFPQEFIIDLGGVAQVAAVDFVSINVRKLSLETCEGDMPDRWDVVAKQLEMPNMQDRTQSQRNLKVNRKARYLKFTIMDGWQEFCAVNYVGVRGTMQ